jgi:hypothetical protein
VFDAKCTTSQQLMSQPVVACISVATKLTPPTAKIVDQLHSNGQTANCFCQNSDSLREIYMSRETKNRRTDEPTEKQSACLASPAIHHSPFTTHPASPQSTASTDTTRDTTDPASHASTITQVVQESAS